VARRVTTSYITKKEQKMGGRSFQAMSLLAGEIHPIVESSCAVVLVNAPSVVSTEIIESLVTDGKEAWGQLGRELEDVGISVTLLTRHR
jgi:hypothetical protein